MPLNPPKVGDKEEMRSKSAPQSVRCAQARERCKLSVLFFIYSCSRVIASGCIKSFEMPGAAQQPLAAPVLKNGNSVAAQQASVFFLSNFRGEVL
ncbi:hypothetical protein BK132_16490 [Paenibacillus sp. FSL H8-0259]|nr:hypothetical protein BK132_16490 [Paenibacillus sp. FSL H8-0259]